MLQSPDNTASNASPKFGCVDCAYIFSSRCAQCERANKIVGEFEDPIASKALAAWLRSDLTAPRA